jgi:hypothetical protein
MGTELFNSSVGSDPTGEEIMDEKTWHDTWIATLIGNGFSQRQAHHIFFICYGNQELNLGKDPVRDASMFLPAPGDDLLLEGEESAHAYIESVVAEEKTASVAIQRQPHSNLFRFFRRLRRGREADQRFPEPAMSAIDLSAECGASGLR